MVVILQSRSNIALWTVSCIVTLLFSSCVGNERDNMAVVKALNENLINNNYALTSQNEVLYLSMEEKHTRPELGEIMNIWHPRALQVKKYSDDISAYIDQLQDSIQMRVGSTGERDKQVVNDILLKQEKGKELFLKLQAYHEAVLGIDPLIDKIFREIMATIKPAFDSNKNFADFVNKYFSNQPAINAIAMLNSFQNNIKTIENMMVAFCNERHSGPHFRFDFYNPMVSQSSSHVKKGESIEITAGVVAFVTEMRPEVIVGGQRIPVGSTGMAIYKQPTKVSGKHQIPVIINYTSQDGERKSFSTNVIYTVNPD